jgi:hypothetical protein
MSCLNQKLGTAFKTAGFSHLAHFLYQNNAFCGVPQTEDTFYGGVSPPWINHRLRLEKLLCVELSRSPNGFFKVLLGPVGGFAS